MYRHALWPAIGTLLFSSTIAARSEVARPTAHVETSTMMGDSSRQRSASELAAGIARLGTVARVLYVAAHPDDENTRLLTYLVSGRGATAAYLSMTRGDGGQNLIGAEQGELLGMLRTQELLAARRLDGAEQLFTRARDFGYSKSAEETLLKWGKDETLGDVVRAIRRFRPDVVITRFSTKPPNHGHHTASALLAAEAFEAAGDVERFPAAGFGPPWKPNRLLYNASTWSFTADTDLSAYLPLDVGGYDALLGRSYGEVAAESRSQHRSQGFGVAPERGPVMEYFQPLAGQKPRRDIFDGLDLGWSRFPQTAKLRAAIARAEKSFDIRAPAKSLPALVAVHRELVRLPHDNPAKATKLREVEALMLEAAGLHLDARAAAPTVTPGSSIDVKVRALNRSPVRVVLGAIQAIVDGKTAAQIDVAAGLAQHKPFDRDLTLAVPADAAITTPYWLRATGTEGRYRVDDGALIGLPEDGPSLAIKVELEVAGYPLAVRTPVVFANVDPVEGERVQRVDVVPAVTVAVVSDVLVVPNKDPVSLSLALGGGRDGVEGEVRVELPAEAVAAGWRVTPANVPFALEKRSARRMVDFRVMPGKGWAKTAPQASGGGAGPALRIVTVVAGQSSSWTETRVSYPHIAARSVRAPAEVRLVPVELAKGPGPIAYIPGPGDKVAQALAAVGYDVTLLTDDRLAEASPAELDRYAAILVGVRAFNASSVLPAQRDKLLGYVERGGRLVVQYNTNSRLGPLPVNPGPYALEIGRGRVTDEAAQVTLVAPQHAFFRTPNAITDEDFAGWVQERGLYFADKWDDRYQALIRMHDDGEAPLDGALLAARHGKGVFVYTGLSFFRQLPAGVPGAYRLLANLLAR